MHIVDRRLNPKAKSLGNRQRFLRRAKAEIRDAVRESLRKRKVSDVDGGEDVRIRSKSLREPTFGLGREQGERDYVLPGNREYKPGDVIRKQALIINLPGQPRAIQETLEGLKDGSGKPTVHGIFAAVPYCLDLIGAPFIETDPNVCNAFRPKKK